MSEDGISSNTVGNSEKKPRGKPFVKGDVRINRKGRPRSFEEVRKLFQSISHEMVTEEGKPVIIGGHKITTVEQIARSWATSKNPILQQKFIEVAYGKVPENINIGGFLATDNTITIRGVDYRTVAAALAPGSVPDSDTPGEDQSSRDGSQVG